MSWQLIARSFAVLRTHPRLVLFPLFSGLTGVAIMALYVLSPVGQRVFGDSALHSLGIADVAALFLIYWLLYFVVIFFNCALVACAQATFAGTEMSIGGSIAKAASRIQPILIWSLFSSTIGILIRAIHVRMGKLSKLAVWLFGAAWNLATFLVVPVLIIEGLGAVESFHRSTSLLRKTWGEQITVGIGIGWISLILSVPGLVLGALGANYYSPVWVAAVLYFVILAAVMTAVRRIFDVALYRYATSREAVGFPLGMLNEAFVVNPRPSA